MKLLNTLILVYLLTTSTAAAVPPPRARIFQGQKATVDQFPYLTLLSLHFSTVIKFCSGTLIDAEWILTAAHCIFSNSSSPVGITARVGSNQRYLGGITVIGIEYAVHNEYNNVTLQNDIALVKIQAINLDKYPNIKPVALPFSQGNETSYVNKKAVAVGWGRNGNNKVSTVLQWSTFYVAPIEECRKRLRLRIPYSHMCVLPIAESNNSSICTGDSGGPLVTETEPYELIGVASYITNFGCESAQPMFYTNVTYALEWINYYINASSR